MISAVIPTLGGAERLGRNLASVRESLQAAGDWELLVVEDGGRPVGELPPDVRRIRRDRTGGYGAAVGEGVSAARGEHLLVLNDDVRLERETVARLLAHFPEPDLFAVVPQIRSPLSGVGDEGGKRGVWRAGWIELEDVASRKQQPTLYPVGCCLLCRRDDFLTLGGYAEIYSPFFWEDVELGFRAWRAGLEVRTSPRRSHITRAARPSPRPTPRATAKRSAFATACSSICAIWRTRCSAPSTSARCWPWPSPSPSRRACAACGGPAALHGCPRHGGSGDARDPAPGCRRGRRAARRRDEGSAGLGPLPAPLDRRLRADRRLGRRRAARAGARGAGAHWPRGAPRHARRGRGLDLDAERVVADHHAGGIRFPPGLREGVRRHVFNGANRAATSRLIEAERPDVVSFWNPAWVTYSPLAAARSAGVPSVVHVSDVCANVFRNPHPPAFPSWARGVARSLVDTMLRRARPRRILVPSRFLADRLVSREALPETLVEVLPWPIEPSADGLPTPEPRPSAPRRLLFVGSLIPEKGPLVALEALELALPDVPDLRLTMVGDGPADGVEAIAERARRLPVELTGKLERERVIEAYRNHDALIFPSVWDEPFSVVPLEAMAMGVAVVASDAGGTPEALEDGVDGLLVARGDAGQLAAAIVRLANDEQLARRLATQGALRVRQRFSFAGFVTRLEEIYAGVAATRRAA